CVLCEAHPTTASSYIQHVYDQHKSNLRSNGISLFCSCGQELRSTKGAWNHNKKCDARLFTLHKLDNN
ncbi:hypothetical protein PENTCL1PPCAC_13209, partial [Pristionchus entomophagus]